MIFVGEDGLLTGGPNSTATVVVGLDQPNPTQTCPVITLEPRVACIDRKEVIIRAFQDPLHAPLKITIGPNSDFTVVPLNGKY